jgi:hypothetical protein
MHSYLHKNSYSYKKWVLHSGSRPCLSAKVGSGVATCYVVSCGPQTSSIKKSLVCLPVQLGTYVPNACAHISKAPDVRAIMGLQDVWASSVFNACKACG